jgi:hypothetical protein
VATDRAGNVSAPLVRHYQVVAAPPAPTPTPPSSGGGGGGGGGGLPPDLHVDLSANAANTPAVGSELIYQVKVSTKNNASSSAVLLTLTLPAGYTVTRMYTDRGAGCSGAAPTLVCDVAWIAGTTTTTVTIWGTVGQAGELDATATVASLVETELASTLGDNTTTLKILPVAPPPPPPAPPAKPPVLTRAGGVFVPARAAHVGKAAVVKASVKVDKAVSLKITAIDDRSRPFTLLKGSKVASIVTAKAGAQLLYKLRAAGTVPMTLQIPYGLVKRGHAYKIVVVATAADGQSSRLVIAFRS